MESEDSCHLLVMSGENLGRCYGIFSCYLALCLGIITCSSPVTEDVPPRRDWSIHGVPPSVTGLVLSRSVPLYPTSVNGPVH